MSDLRPLPPDAADAEHVAWLRLAHARRHGSCQREADLAGPRWIGDIARELLVARGWLTAAEADARRDVARARLDADHQHRRAAAARRKAAA